MSKPISLKIQDALFRETESLLQRFHWPRNSYINRAIAHFNRHHKRKLLAQSLRSESKAVHGSSLEVLAEFEAIEDVLP